MDLKNHDSGKEPFDKALHTDMESNHQCNSTHQRSYHYETRKWGTNEHLERQHNGTPTPGEQPKYKGIKRMDDKGRPSQAE